MRGRKMSGLVTASLTLLLVALQVSTASAAPVRFGAKLTTNTQPSNSVPSHECDPDPGASCTRVMMQALNRSGGQKAPKTGTIHKIRLIAGEAGSLRIYIAQVKVDSTNLANSKAKVVVKGPKLTFQGQPDNFNGYKIETFNVNIPVVKGQYLAIKTNSTSVLRCNSGGTAQLEFQPALTVGAPYRTADDNDGCFMLVEAQY